MADIMIHLIPYGRAFAPLNDAGREWCTVIVEDYADGALFAAPYACMEGFDAPAFGCEPRDFDDLFDVATDVGLTMCDPAGRVIARAMGGAA